MDHPAARQSPGGQRRDHGAVFPRGPGASGRNRRAAELDPGPVQDRHQVLMLALRWGERALPLAWRVEETDGAIGFDTQQALLEAVARWLPEEASVRLMGDRFYGTADLIGWCQGRGWDYRLRLKGNLAVFDATGKTTTGQCAKDRVYYLEDVELTARRARTHIGIIQDPGHAEPWIIAMSEKPGYLRTLEYSARWGIEPMFSDFKSRGFGIEDTQLPLRANDDETQAPRKFRLEGAGELSRGHAQQSCRDEGRRWRRHRGRPEADGCAGTSGGQSRVVRPPQTTDVHGGRESAPSCGKRPGP